MGQNAIVVRATAERLVAAAHLCNISQKVPVITRVWYQGLAISLATNSLVTTRTQNT